MTEKKSPDDVLSILRNEARKAVAASYEDGLQAGLAAQAEARASKQQLNEQFNERYASLMADQNKSPAKLRKIQAEFMEAGLTWEDVDVAPRGSAVDARRNDMNSPAAFRRRS